ncbi:MarR family winged helix-turn-helix transcriptional regulator [Pseudonocardia pini]|uniref:MarR family winged helix-turn-helix transcriptional regulator n=1 Tax=Pseudonocardia pini TaxID=2758030 RepID=UPI0015F0C5AF|nr:MarR family winged helix-turn-helix transcriptional regulator [Pseudonocardia pini]
MSEIAVRLRDVVAASDAYRQTTARLLGLGVPETTILVHLLHDGPRTPTALARRVGVTPASVTAQLDRLELAGHVVRQANPRDRRSVLVALTPAGRALVDRIFAVFRADVARGTADTDPAILDEVARILGEVSQHLTERAHDEPGMARDLGLQTAR